MENETKASEILKPVVERYINRAFGARLWNASGTGKTASEAKKACLEHAASILETDTTPHMEFRHGFLIVIQRTDKNTASYCIKDLSEVKDGAFYMSCHCAAHMVRQYVESDLAQRMSDKAGVVMSRVSDVAK